MSGIHYPLEAQRVVLKRIAQGGKSQRYGNIILDLLSDLGEVEAQLEAVQGGDNTIKVHLVSAKKRQLSTEPKEP